MEQTLELLQGHTLTSIEGMTPKSEEVRFTRADGAVVRMRHWQDCCESVHLADVVGDPADLIGVPLELAVGSSSQANVQYGSETWTYYRFRTIKGTVSLRWFGESNGYYSEDVDVELLKAEE